MKTEWIQIRLTKAEKELLKERAKKEGVTLSAYVLKSVGLGDNVATRDKGINLKFKKGLPNEYRF